MSNYMEEGVGKIRRRPNPAHISGEYMTEGASGDEPSAMEEKRIFEAVRKFNDRFPRGSVVFQDRERLHYGTTVNSTAYVDPINYPVMVIDIDDKPNTWAHWETSPLVRKED